MLRLNVSNPELFETRTFLPDSQTKCTPHGNEAFVRKTTCLYHGRYLTCCLAPFCYLRSDFQEPELSRHITTEIQSASEKCTLNPQFRVKPSTV